MAVPVQPLLPPWLLTLLVALACDRRLDVQALVARLVAAAAPPPIQTAMPATPPPALVVRPELGDATLRLEVSGRSLISMDVRVRVARGVDDHSLDAGGDALVVEERRLYE